MRGDGGGLVGSDTKVFRGVLQRVAVCCSALQCDADVVGSDAWNMK